MRAIEMELFMHEITWTKDTRNLKALRAMFEELLDSKRISLETYRSINQEIRNRADFLKGRK